MPSQADRGRALFDVASHQSGAFPCKAHENLSATAAVSIADTVAAFLSFTAVYQPPHPFYLYDVGFGFIYIVPSACVSSNIYRQNLHLQLTFLLPPVMVTLTKRRVYVILFFARPLGVFFFSCGSTFGV
jgi:hypothetical protein